LLALLEAILTPAERERLYVPSGALAQRNASYVYWPPSPRLTNKPPCAFIAACG
jgi:hypothetical protein